jgi:hypothetical protein
VGFSYKTPRDKIGDDAITKKEYVHRGNVAEIRTRMIHYEIDNTKNNSGMKTKPRQFGERIKQHILTRCGKHTVNRNGLMANVAGKLVR